MELVQARLRSSIMMKRWLAAVLVAVPVAAAANISLVKNVPYLPLPKGSAVILNTGSTNTAGYRIVVGPDGSAQSVVAGFAPVKATIPPELARKFFADLETARPLQDLPHGACMKSASFGTSLFVWWKHGRSPDVSCPADARGKVLAADANEIAQALHLGGFSREPVMRPLMPGDVHKPLPPVPNPSHT